ncbi:MAG: methylmalonyl-CoA mutase family protein, partial [Cruoricaptor ignavus]|nr:methylmalonyl-CoA mutase family protein [Cruoricaptor ignavus]
MFAKIGLQDWEKMVQKQLKTEDIYSILSKENLENLTVKPYYDSVQKPLKNLPKIEESTHLVASYHPDLEENVFAFLLEQDIENTSEKALFINQKDLAKSINPKENETYFSLIDVLDEPTATIDLDLANELLSKNFVRKIGVDLALHQNAGASIIQQVAIALAKTKELAEVFGKEIFSKIILKIAIGSNYFFEIAKIRALKLAFNQLSKEYGLDEIPYIYAETSLR